MNRTDLHNSKDNNLEKNTQIREKKEKKNKQVVGGWLLKYIPSETARATGADACSGWEWV